MKKLLCLLLISSAGFSQSPADAPVFTPEALKQDLNFLFEKLEAIHPSLYHYTSKAEIDELRAATEKMFNRPMTRLEFAQKVIPIVSQLSDAHTSLGFLQKEYSTFLKNGGKVFPLDVLIRENRIFTTAAHATDSIVPSTEILSINGVRSTEVLKTLRSYISAELDFYRDIRVQRAFRRMLWFVYGWDNDFDLQLSTNGEVINRKIQGITEVALSESYRKTGSTIVSPFSYYPLENKIGVIDFQSMKNLKKFSSFLDSTFAVIGQNNIQYLVIDIRNNGGGDSKLGEALFDYIADKPYKQFERAEIKNSVEAGRVKNKNSKKNGTISVIQNTNFITPKKTKNKFTGTTYLLTSHVTFSSAHALAVAFKCYEMGTILGEETGGILEPFGDLIEFKLPNTQLQGWCSHKKFVHPCSDGLLHGVKPDVEIIPSAQDMATGNDPALEYIKKIASGN
ncbi:MAG: S41 family peptidase [Cyclobacteriaceae bacterium]